MKIKSLQQKKDWQGQKVLLRVDFNVPQKKGKISEDYRLLAALPTIKFLVDKKARLIIISHWGDPKGVDTSLSTRTLAHRLQKLLKQKIKFVPDTIGDKAKKAAKALQDGEIIFLENLRFDTAEKKNGKKFAQQLAALADVYVNEAFSVCHRQQASVSAVTEYLPAFAGLQLEAEVKNLQKILKPLKPLVVVMGGSKIETKAPLIKQLYKPASHILLGGGLANTFLKKMGIEIGRSLCDAKSSRYLNKFFSGKKISSKIILPIDVIVKTIKGKSQHRHLKDIKKSDCILDIGPETIFLFSSYIKKAQTIVWNGPLGKFEEIPFKHGTLAIASIVAARSTGKAFGLVGGGETVEALKMTKMETYVDWVSTAGGAMLSYLGGEKMPGLKNIIY
ncbi:MAG: phosphoglycerate kinase [Patescibacteria group bacterium]|nr:phosphoglycerate kinase [Patescibacteria group bacterium]